MAGVGLFAGALAVVAIDGAALSGQMMAMIVPGAMLGFALDATWLTLAMDRLSKLGHGRQDEGGGKDGERQSLTRRVRGRRLITPTGGQRSNATLAPTARHATARRWRAEPPHDWQPPIRQPMAGPSSTPALLFSLLATTPRRLRTRVNGAGIARRGGKT